MLSWPFQIDEAFAAILDSSLSICIVQVGDCLSDQGAGVFEAADVEGLSETRIWELFDPANSSANCRNR